MSKIGAGHLLDPAVDAPKRPKGVTDYSLAKAEIPGPDGTWILTGHLLRLNKENVLVGRMAKLVKPDGKVAGRRG